MNINENAQPPIDREAATKYSVILFVNLGEYILKFISNINQTFFFNALTFCPWQTLIAQNPNIIKFPGLRFNILFDMLYSQSLLKNW